MLGLAKPVKLPWNSQPPREVLSRLGGRKIVRTDQYGTITLTNNGQPLWVERER